MELLFAVADPTRRRIVELLAAQDRTAGEIVAEFQMSAPAISQHLKILQQAGLVKVRSDGPRRIQSLDFRGIKQIESWLFRTRRIWESRLDALEQQLLAERESRKNQKKHHS